jgi:structure-specific endonuclease subunit SLX1
MSFFVYLLITDSFSNTYVGATIDLDRRLRQHNKEIKGGARATSAKVTKGETWERVCYISGFPNWSATLQFEWRWKQINRIIPFGKSCLERRMRALKQLLSLPQSTNKAIPFTEWTSPPEIHFELEEAEHLYYSL